MNVKALAATLLLVVSAVGPATAAAVGATQQGEAYSGTYVSFQSNADAIADYSVNGETVVDSVAVQSTSKAQSSGGIAVDADLKSVTNFQAAGLSVQSSFEGSASTTTTMRSESGATIAAHDNDRGIMVVTASDGSQYVRANLSSGSSAQAAGENRVVVSNDDGTKGTFIVVGEGDVTVNEEGHVTAKLQEDAQLVYRQYNEERSQSDKQQEQLIASGTATAEVYYQQTAESGGDAKQRTVDVVQYGQQTSIEVTSKTQNHLNMTVERAESQGKVVIVSASEAAMNNAENAKVYVDGEAAVKASSYSEVKSATNGGETSKYLVRSSSSAQASSDVVVGVNHFSKRQMSVQSGDGGGGGGGGGITGDAGPGFGGLLAIAAIGAALFARARL